VFEVVEAGLGRSLRSEPFESLGFDVAPSPLLPVAAAAAPSVDPAPEPESELEADAPSPAGAGARADRWAVARSFLAQPEPLKTIEGALMPFRSVPSAPHAGQKRGPASSLPWMTSVRWRQAEQM
jgi:hypothetical protein